jgi:YggT family protein
LEAGREVLRSALWLYFWAIFIYALLSMIAPGQDSPLLDILEALCEPVLSRIRRAVPSFAGLDLSPMWAAIIIQVLLILLR